MSHFAKVVDGIVTDVIVAEQEFIDIYDDGIPGEWIQTSYNTFGGKHYTPDSHDEDGGVALRKNYAGLGYTYDKTRDAFIPPQPYSSWTLNEDTCQWDAPVPYPRTEEDDDPGLEFLWKEDILNWVVKVGQRGLAVDDPGDTSWIDGMSPEQIAQGKIDGNYSPIRWISDTEYVPLVKEK